MAAIEVSDKEVIDFRYNFKVYFGFLSKYKGVCVFLILLAFVIQALDLALNCAFTIGRNIFREMVENAWGIKRPIFNFNLAG